MLSVTQDIVDLRGSEQWRFVVPRPPPNPAPPGTQAIGEITAAFDLWPGEAQLHSSAGAVSRSAC